MRRFVLRRLLLMVPTFLGISLLTFAVAHLAPGDPLQLDSERVGADAHAADAFREAQGLGRPLPVQYAVWLGKLARLDFGRSLVDQRAVSEKLAEALPRTVLVSGLALLLAWLGAVPLGTWLAVRAGSRLARGLSALLALASGVPSFWVAVLLLLVFANPSALDWFPYQGLSTEGVSGFFAQAVDLSWHLALPVLVLASPAMALATRHVRAAMTEALARDEVRAARARGIPERRVLFNHALRSSLLPLLTLLGLQLPHLVGGSVVVERVFGLPGMGLLAFDAIGTRDYPVVMAVATVMALVTMLAMLLTDLACAFADPRVRLEGSA